MSTSNFQIVFNVEVSHSYFEQNVCKCLRFILGPVTGVLAKRFKMKIRKRVSGFDFYIDTRASLSSFLQYVGAATGQTYFDFEISATNPVFNFFTDAPAGWNGQRVYDSNSPLNERSGNIVQLIPSLVSGAKAPQVGRLQVHFSDIINQGYTQFTISYTARTTQWQYFIVNNSAVQLQNPLISGKTDISFTGPENVTIETGEQAMLFTSGENRIPLAEVPKYKFNLVNKPASGGGQAASSSQVIFRGLPNPDPIRIGTVMTGETVRVVSPMYVYV
jgi:hypothetical protein